MSDNKSAEPLQFDNDKGAAWSTVFATFFTLGVIAWMGSGFIVPEEDETVDAEPEVIEVKPIAVAVRASQASSVTQYFLAEGQALPDRDTMIRAETSGDIDEILAAKGQLVSAGDILARFDTVQLQTNLTRAKEDLANAEREFGNAQQLLQRGTATIDRVNQARAVVAAAKSALTAAEQAMESTIITVPFDGRLEQFNIDPGTYVSAGTEVGRVVDTDPLTVSIQIPQHSLNRIKVGQMAEVQFITGETRRGEVAFVGSSAASDTRTFLAEITVANPEGEVPAGISAQIRIPTGDIQAHFLSPAILSLNTEGILGLKTVDAENTVQFSPVDIVQARTDGVWVTGIADDVNVITIGQGYVNAGETVAPSVEGAN